MHLPALNTDLVLRILFLAVSGSLLIAYDPLLMIAWPFALFGMVYSRRIQESPIIELCFGVPLIVAVGYVSLVLPVLLIFLLVFMVFPELFITSNRYRFGLVILCGTALILLIVPFLDPFIASLLLLVFAGIGTGVLFLAEYAAYRTVRGDHL